MFEDILPPIDHRRIAEWLLVEVWSATEAASLFNGEDPDNYGYLAASCGLPKHENSNPRHARALARRLKLQDETELVEPQRWLEAADEIGLPVYPDVRAALTDPNWRPSLSAIDNMLLFRPWHDPSPSTTHMEKLSADTPPSVEVDDQKTSESANKKGIPRKRYNSALILIAGVVIDKFRWEPGERGTSIVSNLKSTLDRSGLKLDEDTIRSLLGDVAEECERFSDRT